MGTSELAQEGAHKEKAWLSFLPPFGLCAVGCRGPFLTHAQMGDGLQLLVGDCQMNGSGESEREEKNVPKVRARSRQEWCSGAEGRWSWEAGPVVPRRQTHRVWQYAQMSWTRSWNMSSEPSKETPERHRE